jgi:hypothetical protein
MLISTALLLDSNIGNSICTPAKLPCRRVEVKQKAKKKHKKRKVRLEKRKRHNNRYRSSNNNNNNDNRPIIEYVIVYVLRQNCRAAGWRWDN